MPTTDQIRDSIEHRLNELRGELDALTAARAQLDGARPEVPKRSRSTARRATRSARTANANPTPDATAASPTNAEATTTVSESPSRSVRSPRRTRPKARRSPEVVPAGKLELLLSQSEGLTTATLAELANGKRDQVLTLLRELETAGRVRRSGQRRATRWHVITDEERIEQRAAELTARSKKPST